MKHYKELVDIESKAGSCSDANRYRPESHVKLNFGLGKFCRMSLFFRTIEINWLATIEFQLTALARVCDIGVLLSLCVTTAGYTV